MWKDFKAFIARGNVIDLAVAVIIGAAFGLIVASFVDDIIMPPIGLVLGGVDFQDLFINLSSKPAKTLAEAKAAGITTINYGQFLNTVIKFLIIAVAVFLLLRVLTRAKILKTPDPEPVNKNCPYCITTVPAEATRCPACTSELVAA